jgi:tetratricopeptide (TPR) repeat protein
LENAEKALAIDPTDAAAQESQVQALVALGRGEEAVTKGEAYVKDNPRNDGVASVLGQYFLATRNFAQAERYLRIAVSGTNPRRGSRAQLALLAVAAGARGDAMQFLEDEVRDFPGNLLARRLLNRLLAEDQRWLDQREHAAYLVRALPNEARAILNLAQCLFNIGDYAGARRHIDDARFLDPADPDIMLLHANVLAKEGKRDEGYAVFQAANAKNNERVAAATARAKAAEAGGVGDGLDGVARRAPRGGPSR